MRNYFQLTLRELMLVLLFAGVGIVSLSTGGIVASIAVGAAILVTTCLAIIAFVGRGLLRTIAIGFLIPVVMYTGMVLTAGISELDPYEGKLPTTQLIRPAFRLFVKQIYVNINTGQRVLDYDPAKYTGLGSGGIAFGPPVDLKEFPDRATFMSTAHVLLAMLSGYAGSKFAVWIYRRQESIPKDERPTNV